MIHFLQLYKMVDNKKLFINLFNDLSFELDEMGYRDFPEELIQDLLFNHFGLEIEDERQLQRFTGFILKWQSKLQDFTTVVA